MKMIVISGALHYPKTSSVITDALAGLIAKQNLKMLNVSDTSLGSRIKQDQPPIVLLHKTNGNTEKLKKLLEKNSPTTIYLVVDDCWLAAQALIQRKITA